LRQLADADLEADAAVAELLEQYGLIRSPYFTLPQHRPPVVLAELRQERDAAPVPPQAATGEAG
jgi:hypothetical protein